MNVQEVSRVEAVAAAREVSSNPRSELVAAFREALREGQFPEAREKLASGAGELQIAFDREARTYVVKVLDRDTREVVKQIPAEDVLDRARYFVESDIQTRRRAAR
jgi:uncharacterized FlaG/YvyC family protein